MSERLKGVLAMVALAFVFASMGAFARYLQFDFTLLQQTYLRIGLAFLFAALIFATHIEWKKFLVLPVREWGILTFRAVTLYAGVLLVSLAYFSGNYSNVSFVSALPLLPLFGYVFFRDRITPQIVALVLLGFVGVALIAVKDWSNVLSFGRSETLALLSIVFFDFSYIARKWQSDLLSNRESAAAIFFIGSALMFITSLAFGEGLPQANVFTFSILVALVGAALFNIANLVLTNYGFDRLSTTLAGTVLTLETVFALLISVFLYAEIPTAIEFVGSALVLLSVYRINQLT